MLRQENTWFSSPWDWLSYHDDLQVSPFACELHHVALLQRWVSAHCVAMHSSLCSFILWQAPWAFLLQLVQTLLQELWWAGISVVCWPWLPSGTHWGVVHLDSSNFSFWWTSVLSFIVAGLPYIPPKSPQRLHPSQHSYFPDSLSE